MKIEPPDRLEDGVVVLRPLREDDAVPYAAAFGADPELVRLLGLERDPDEPSVRRRVARQPLHAEEGRRLELAIAEPGSDRFQGSLTLHTFEWRHRRCEVGFWLVPEARGRGLGRCALSLAVTWALDALDMLRIEMTTTTDNAAVAALARRLGFTYEGVLRARNFERGERVDIVMFGLLREEWAQ